MRTQMSFSVVTILLTLQLIAERAGESEDGARERSYRETESRKTFTG